MTLLWLLIRVTTFEGLVTLLSLYLSNDDMVSRHIKFHCFRLDLYGKKPRFNAKLAHIVDHYRTDQRNLVKDARSIARKNGWNDGLKEFL